jgi:peroxiredoxin
MGTKVILRTNSPNRVSINNQQRSTVRTVAVASAQVDRLSELTDVDASDADNNEVLVYDETLNKYVIKAIPSVDGGTF